MLRYLSFIIILSVALFAAACGGGDSSGDVQQEPDDDTVYRIAPSDPADPPASLLDADSDVADASETLFGTFDPFQFVSGVEGEAVPGDVDPALKLALLDASDLPSEFVSFGDFSLITPSEFGGIETATSMFVGEDFLSGDFGAMIISAVIALPPEALDELGDPVNLDELAGLTDADLQELMAGAGQFGIEFRDLRALDASGLGQGGLGLHIEMFFGGLFEALAAPETDNPFTDGIAIEMYMFVRGEHALMLMVMLPAGESPAVDARDLADIMDAKAGGLF